MLTTLALFTLLAALYAGSLSLREGEKSEQGTVLGLLALHGALIGHQIFDGSAIRIGITEALSLLTWQSALLLWIFCFREPLRVLGGAIYPMAGLCCLLAVLFPTPIHDGTMDWKTRTHVVLSLLSAGMLTLAATQSVTLALQDRLLHGHRLGAHLSRLPPLLTMERLLFQLIAIGFFLLSLTLLSGLWFIQDWMAQHLAHKTVLSISAWLLFGILLWGRWRHGWRGRTAIHWTLSAYVCLILAYFGSKLILEQILNKHWT